MFVCVYPSPFGSLSQRVSARALAARRAVVDLFDCRVAEQPCVCLGA